MHKGNIEMNEIIANLDSCAANLGLARNVARYDKTETDGTFSVMDNQTDEFKKYLQAARLDMLRLLDLTHLYFVNPFEGE